MTDDDHPRTPANDAFGLSDADRRAVIDANERFYRIFAAGDYAAMETLWAETHPIVCVHPGWAPLAGRDAVLESWQAILAAPEPARVSCRDVLAYGLGPGDAGGAEAAMVLCREVLEGQGVLAATNLFVREGGAWRMVHHHAGPIAALTGLGTETPEGPMH